jgi:hypothetical protein
MMLKRVGADTSVWCGIHSVMLEIWLINWYYIFNLVKGKWFVKSDHWWTFLDLRILKVVVRGKAVGHSDVGIMFCCRKLVCDVGTTQCCHTEGYSHLTDPADSELPSALQPNVCHDVICREVQTWPFVSVM